MLREPNNPYTDKNILNILAQLLPNDPVTLQPNTQVGLNQAPLITSNNPHPLFYVESKYAVGQGQFPAVHLEAGEQKYSKNSRSTYTGELVAIIGYYDRWDKQQNTIDQIRSNIAADLERMKANLEDNDSLAYNGLAYATSISPISLSAPKGEFDEQFPGITLVFRTMTLTINILPYDAN
jgi:hypothetical protein